MMQATAEKEEALSLNEALLREHEELQQFMAQESSSHHNAEGMLHQGIDLENFLDMARRRVLQASQR